MVVEVRSIGLVVEDSMDPLQFSGLNLMKFLMTGRHRKRSGTEKETEREERETGQEVANHFPPVTELSVRHSSREGRAGSAIARSFVATDRAKVLAFHAYDR